VNGHTDAAAHTSHFGCQSACVNFLDEPNACEADEKARWIQIVVARVGEKKVVVNRRKTLRSS
jgi:hypothetical protein